MATSPKKTAPKTEGTDKDKDKKVGRRLRKPDHIIRFVKKETTAREGSVRRQLFDKLRDGMTVEQYAEAISTIEKAPAAGSVIRFFVDAGNVKLEEPKNKTA